MFGVLFKLMFLCLGVFLLAFAAGQAFRSARRLDQRIADFKAEQKELEEQGRSLPPFMAFAEREEEEKTRRRGDRETRR